MGCGSLYGSFEHAGFFMGRDQKRSTGMGGRSHPEVSTVSTVFGHNEVVPRSLDQARDVTPLPGWMSGISTYSMWWIIIHHDWYMAYSDLDYLKEQKSYLQKLVRQIVDKVNDGKEEMGGNRF